MGINLTFYLEGEIYLWYKVINSNYKEIIKLMLKGKEVKDCIRTYNLDTGELIMEEYPSNNPSKN